jgi:hypothetical protein
MFGQFGFSMINQVALCMTVALAIITVIAIINSRGSSKKGPFQPYNPNFNICPQCGSSVPKAYKFCTECGAPIQATNRSPSFSLDQEAEPEQPYDEPTRQAIKNSSNFDELLAEMIKQKILSGDIDVTPSIDVKNKGTYKLLGKSWEGEASLVMKPNRHEIVKVEKERKEIEPEPSTDEEESLF